MDSEDGKEAGRDVPACQLFRFAASGEVEIVDAEEGAAYGAALLAGVGAGIWASVDAACIAVVRVAKKIRPNEDAVITLNKNYAAYRRIYAATRDIFSTV